MTTPAAALTGARCVGRWWLFDSTDLAEHAEAAAICAECPVLLACRRHVREVLAAGASVNHYGITGTWAGQLYGRVGQRVPAEAVV